MTTFFILTAVYLLSAYLLRKLFIREKLTDGVAMFLVACPLVNTIGILVVSVAIIVDSLQGKFNWNEIAKKFFAERS